MEDSSPPPQPEDESSPPQRKLTEEEVLSIFDHVHHNRSLPPALQFQVIPVDPKGSKITPPQLNFKGGLFVLCDTDSPRFPRHLMERVSRKPMPKSNFHWHPAKKDGAEFVQMRNCYRYNGGNVGGPPAYIWTKFDKDGNENFQYRLMHVLLSKKGSSVPEQSNKPVKTRPPKARREATISAETRSESVKAVIKKRVRVPKVHREDAMSDDTKSESKKAVRKRVRVPKVNLDDVFDDETWVHEEETPKRSKPTLNPGDVISSPRPEDVASTRDRKWHTRPSNELFRSLVINAAQATNTNDPQAVKKVSERIVDIIMIDRKGVFVRNIKEKGDSTIYGWEVMDRKESVYKATQAIRNCKAKEANGGWYKSKPRKKTNNGNGKKKSRSHHSAAARKKKIVYQAQAGVETSIHPYALLLISAVCNQPQDALRVLHSPLNGIFEEGRTETCAERAMRLQLRHRFAGALSNEITPQTFSERLLAHWGGSLLQAEEGSSSNLDAGRQELPVTQAEKGADQDASEDGNDESSDVDGLSEVEGEQTCSDDDEDSDSNESE